MNSFPGCCSSVSFLKCLSPTGASQAKKKHFDTELENMEKHQKQTIEKIETEHSVKLKEETKRIKTEQDREYHKFMDQLKHKKKEVWFNCTFLFLVISLYKIQDLTWSSEIHKTWSTEQLDDFWTEVCIA